MSKLHSNVLCSRLRNRFRRAPEFAQLSLERIDRVAEKLVMVGVLPEVIVLDPGEQVVWYSNAGNIKVEFDPQRCPFSSNVFQAPPGVRLVSGSTRAGLNPGSYKYRLSLNEQVIAHGEVLLRGK
jgi:hypothetical protein